MTTALRPRTLILFIGDIGFFVFALWLSLYLRAFEVPSRELFAAHLLPFTLLFIVWLFVFFVAGLYESRSIILERRRISMTLLVSQIANIIIAALFFFFVPIFGIAPKAILFIYLIVSFLLVLLWRVALFPLLAQKVEHAIVVGEGKEIDELTTALFAAPRAPARIVARIRPSEAAVVYAVKAAIAEHSPRFIIADFNNAAVAAAFPELYNYLAQGIRFIDAMSLYEEVFGRVPLSVIDDKWIARNISRSAHTLYDALKRFMDIVFAGSSAVISLIFYPFIMLAILIDSGFPVFISQERVGQDNRPVRVYKFRSMSGNDEGKYGVKGTSKFKVTRVGKFLRITRLDELPQLWSIVLGRLSFVGPRPELPSLVQLYEKEIPYYMVRHLIKPGLSGWAQLYHDNHPHHGEAVEATKEKLSYDLYYIKHRSLMLDLIIAAKTIKKLLSRSGV
jgi:lipopolysaccharide/colanic/teichoic acid biosynthesis glycosyltransferase